MRKPYYLLILFIITSTFILGCDEEEPLRKPDYTGSLDESAVIAFGGAPYCDYDIRFRQIKSTITSDLNNSELSMISDERTVGSCPYAPDGLKNMSFESGSITKNADEIKITFRPVAPANNSLKVSYQGKVSRSKVSGILTIIRDDIPEPDRKFDYKFDINLELSAN